MRIFLIRHGESLGNVDESAYRRIPDYEVPLTQWGYEQAVEAGKAIRAYYDSHPEIKDKKPRLWYSPFRRTQQTKDGLIEGFGGGETAFNKVWEDDRLREQDFGLFSLYGDKDAQEKISPEMARLYNWFRDNQGKYYARPPLGESRADVTLRVGAFVDTMMRDAAHGVEDVALALYGVSVRSVLKDFLHKTVEWFEKEPNPGNCDVILIEGDSQKGYRVSKIHEGKQRPAHLPKDYKTTAYGEPWKGASFLAA